MFLFNGYTASVMEDKKWFRDMLSISVLTVNNTMYVSVI